MRTKNFKFTALLLIFGAAFFNQISAQTTEQRVAKIRQLYTATNERIEAGLEDKSEGLHHAAITVGGDKDGQQWRAVGSHNETTEFYFDCEPDEPECKKDPQQLVVKIVRTYQAGSSITSRYEYLFNDKGELVFAFTIEADDDNNPIERRFYFAGKKLIRVTRDGKNYDANFRRADAGATDQAVNDAQQLKKLFAMIL